MFTGRPPLLPLKVLLYNKRRRQGVENPRWSPKMRRYVRTKSLLVVSYTLVDFRRKSRRHFHTSIFLYLSTCSSPRYILLARVISPSLSFISFLNIIFNEYGGGRWKGEILTPK
jgi:hypothetical protein